MDERERRAMVAALERAEVEIQAAQARGDGLAVERWKTVANALQRRARHWLRIGGFRVDKPEPTTRPAAHRGRV